MNRRVFCFTVLQTGLAVVGFCGCEKRRETAMVTFDQEDCDRILLIDVDLSGSFEQLMVEDGKCYQFCLDVLEKYTREHAGSQNKIILAQISGSDRPVLWEGTPQALREDFPTPEAFREFLLSKSQPGSHVHDSVAHGIEYLLKMPAIANGQAKSAVFVLSDLIDNSPNPQVSEQRLVEALEKYSAVGGVCYGWYGDEKYARRWESFLKQTGVKGEMSTGIKARPKPPNFD